MQVENLRDVRILSVVNKTTTSETFVRYFTTGKLIYFGWLVVFFQTTDFLYQRMCNTRGTRTQDRSKYEFNKQHLILGLVLFVSLGVICAAFSVCEVFFGFAGHFEFFAGHLIEFNSSSSPDILNPANFAYTGFYYSFLLK